MRHCSALLALLVPMVLTACGGAETDDGDTEADEPAASGLPETKEAAAGATNDGKADWSLDICTARGWYGDGECDWFCPKRDADCDLPPLEPDPAGNAAKYPIVLAHGFDASPTNRWGFYRLVEALRADGHAVHVAIVPPYDAVSVRGEALAEHVDEALAEFGAERVNLIAHSMGGLDSRYVVSSLGYGDRVASVTTISSPHRGAPVADFALKALPRVADPLVNALATLWGRTYSDVAGNSQVRAALEGISEASAPGFNAENPDVSGVYYQSWAGVSSALGIGNGKDAAACQGKLLRHPGTSDKLHATLMPMAAITAGGTRLTPNDGMVTIASAMWGEFKGCIPADHLDEVGQPKHDAADKDTAFDHVRFYRNLAFDLAARGY